MDVDEDALIGEPLEEVPEQPPGYDCNARRHDDGVFQGYCSARAGKGTDVVGEGRCSSHGGASDGAPEGNTNAEDNDGGAPEENTNAVSHGAYADCNSYYQDILDDDLRAFVDDVFADYLEKYKEQHGEPALGIKAELFRVSVTHAKDIGLDRWASSKPDGLESGHPLVDKETKVKTTQHETATEVEYKEAVVLAAQKRLSNDRRMWLKDLGLLEDPDSQDAAAKEDVADALREVLK